ncbi:Protein phosphatase 1 regulatory subunit 15A [Habropoda laboriosa]|uniref:Protein DP71L n=2 Tax=Habropoda laboriosa TaxID=597456 RepID=A0A0L7QQH5_9HYME|nr:Protein phosphatase 1 regulatory subunit 15A [Habropoda laboriosa]
MFHSVFNALNILREQFSKVSASFIASINYPLSVTLVNNEGVIPQDFFKNLTNKRELLGTDDIYIHNTQLKESLNIVESVHSDVFDEKQHYVGRIFNENTEANLKFSYEYIDNKNKDTRSGKKESVIKDDIKSNTTNCNYLVPIENSNKVCEQKLYEYICSDINAQKVYAGNNCENTYSKSTCNKEQFSNYVCNSVDDKMITHIEPPNCSPSNLDLCTQSVQQTTVSNLFTNMFQKVFGGVTNRFCRTDSESDITMKRSFLSKQRRKLNAAAKGRGRGRGKSQLRRSGVSQTRHRKEHTKHDIEEDIQSDFTTWQEFEICHITESKESEDYFSVDEDTVDGFSTVHYVIPKTVSPVAYTFADVKPKIQKSNTRRNVDQGISKFSAKMKSIPECTEETNIFDQNFVEDRYNLQKNTFRPRLISESSIDSEDSYCIVFETSSEVTYKSDLDSEESEETSEDEGGCKDEESVPPVQKVKFNLNPVVHVMMHWDYAYRAARKGPWEEMARDRERFRGRINCIERVLNPILTTQHRTHIWQERFALTK